MYNHSLAIVDTKERRRNMSSEMTKKMVEIADTILEKSQEYFEEYSKINSKKAHVWIKNDDTNQLAVYTRGENTEEILKFLQTLN